MRHNKKEGIRKEYKSATNRRNHNRERNLGTPQEAPNSSAATMEYIAAMEERAEIHNRRIDKLQNYDRAMTIPATDTAAASNIT